MRPKPLMPTRTVMSLVLPDGFAMPGVVRVRYQPSAVVWGGAWAQGG